MSRSSDEGNDFAQEVKRLAHQPKIINRQISRKTQKVRKFMTPVALGCIFTSQIFFITLLVDLFSIKYRRTQWRKLDGSFMIKRFVHTDFIHKI